MEAWIIPVSVGLLGDVQVLAGQLQVVQRRGCLGRGGCIRKIDKGRALADALVACQHLRPHKQAAAQTTRSGE